MQQRPVMAESDHEVGPSPALEALLKFDFQRYALLVDYSRIEFVLRIEVTERQLTLLLSPAARARCSVNKPIVRRYSA